MASDTAEKKKSEGKKAERKHTTYLILHAVDIDGVRHWRESGTVSAPNQVLAKRQAAGDLHQQGALEESGELTVSVVPFASWKPSTGRIELAQPRLVLG